MIKTKKELKNILTIEKKLYLADRTIENIIRLRMTNENLYWIWKYVYYLRKCEYYLNNNKKVSLFVYRRLKNKVGQNLSIEIKENCFDSGLRIFHGNVVVNEKARIGKNCRLHGNNCIGNNGKIDKCPRIGDNFDLGIGGVVVGEISIGNNVTVGAMSFVNKSTPSNCTIVGIPGKVLN